MAGEIIESNEIQQFCTFRFREQLFGVNILEVKEIDKIMPFTPVHHAPPEVKGLVNIRGQIYLILDMAALMGAEQQDIQPENRLLIFKDSVGESFGILVDRIGDVINVDPKNISQYQDEKANVDTLPKAGVCQLKEDLMVIIKGSQVLERVQGIMQTPVVGVG